MSSVTVDRIYDQKFVLPVKKYPRLLAPLLRWFQKRCRHWNLKADILEGCGGDYSVRWCETCGAVWIVIDGCPCGLPRIPEPTWEG
jgi:hypothetical protein